MSLYFLCCSANVSVCPVCYVLDSVCKLPGETIRDLFGRAAALLPNVMDVFSVGGGALLDRPCMVFPQNVRVVPVIPRSV